MTTINISNIIDDLLKNKKYNLPDQINLVISGGGIAVYYSIGVIECLRKLNIKINKISCVSAATIIGVSYFCDFNMGQIIKSYYETMKIYEQKPDLLESLKKELINKLPLNAHELCNEKLFITANSISTFKLEKHLYNNFTSKDDLINIMIASCTIPYITNSSYCTIHNDKNMIDGIDPYFLCETGEITLNIDHNFVDYSYKNRFHFCDNDINLLILKGAINFEKFLSKNETIEYKCQHVCHCGNKSYKKINDDINIEIKNRESGNINDSTKSFIWCNKFELCENAKHVNKHQYGFTDMFNICYTFIFNYFNK